MPDIKGMLNTLHKVSEDAATYEISTDFQYSGLKEYPRPQMKRESCEILNGQWELSILGADSRPIYEGTIEVPFSPECRLSGVNHVLMPYEQLIYKRSIVVNEGSLDDGKRLLIHFGAVDQITTLFVNGKQAGNHEGGYTAFTFDITDYVKTGENELKLNVIDQGNELGYARGKQAYDHSGMFYTPQSGIWQTVWLEIVEANYIKHVNYIPDIKRNELRIVIDVVCHDVKESYKNDFVIEALNEKNDDYCDDCFKPLFDFKLINVKTIDKSEFDTKKQAKYELLIEPEDYELWTVDNPVLYMTRIRFGADSVQTYFAMRSFYFANDKDNIPRIYLNHEPIFMNGVLDQGYFPESLMTPPSDEAMIFDISQMKKLGFNMLRKHCKIEPMRWYYHCDRLGMVVWQDIVNGGGDYNMNMICTMPTLAPHWKHFPDTTEFLLSITGRKNRKMQDVWFKEAKETVEQLIAVPSLALWTVFNEGWGQFDCVRCTDFIRSIDGTRLIDSASGWFHQGYGDICSDHIYFFKLKVRRKMVPFVISEYGGYSLKCDGHVYRDALYGYKPYTDSNEFKKGMHDLLAEIDALVDEGLCGAVLTQLTDVEDELNGIFTYDRKVNKLAD